MGATLSSTVCAFATDLPWFATTVTPRRSAVGEPVRRLGGLAFRQEPVRAALDLAVGNAHALVLAQVLGPRFVHERLEVARRLGRIVEQLPEERAVAPAHLAHVAHRRDELGAMRGVDA